jgi:hypothetical protein
MLANRVVSGSAAAYRPASNNGGRGPCFKSIHFKLNNFSSLNGLSDAELSERGVQVHISDGGFPCRVSLEDVTAGERVFLLNFEHQPGKSPYRSRHAIFVKEGAEEAHPDQGAIPASITEPAFVRSRI